MATGQGSDEEPVTMTRAFEDASLINGAVCTAIGTPLNALLVWAVVYRSPEELCVYKKVLLSTAAIDTVFLVLCYLVQPMSVAGVAYAIV